MAYATGVAVNAAALQQAIKTFALAQGWTLHVEDTFTLSFLATTTSGARLHNDAYSLLSSLHSSNAYDYQSGQSTRVAARVVLGKNGVAWQLFAYDRLMMKNGVSGTYGCLEAWVCDGYNGAVAANLQTNNRKYAVIAPLAATLAGYHLFSNGDFIHLVVEETTNRFRHLSFGFLTQCGGAWSGGQYLTAGCPIEAETTTALDFNYATNVGPQIPFGMVYQVVIKATLATNAFSGTYVRADIDGLTVAWRLLNRSGSYFDVTNGSAWGVGVYSNIAKTRGGEAAATHRTPLGGDLGYNCAPQSWNGLAPMLPCYVGVFRSPWTGNWTLLGQFPDVRFLNIANFTPGEELTLGTDVWKIFPLWFKSYTPLDEPISWDYGLAYKKVV